MKTIYHPGYRRLMGKLRAARKDAGLRLVDAAHLVGRRRDWLHRVETSQVRLDVLQFVQLCRALNLSSPALLEELEESSDDDSFLAISRLSAWLSGGTIEPSLAKAGKRDGTKYAPEGNYRSGSGQRRAHSRGLGIA